jgi:hypothetical protein
VWIQLQIGISAGQRTCQRFLTGRKSGFGVSRPYSVNLQVRGMLGHPKLIMDVLGVPKSRIVYTNLVFY